MSGPGFLSETRERFLKAILSQLPLERVREMYLFPAIRQGGVESGVAVVAGYPEGAPAAEADTAAPGPSSEAEPVAAEAAEAPVCEVEPTVAPASPEGTEPPVEVEPATQSEPVSEAEMAAEGEPGADAGPADGESAESGEPAPAPAAPPAEKYTVYTAHYRHVLKGPDRGKWEATLVAEAEAPLLSIESVVRGVQRRAGDVESPDHMTAADVRSALRLGPAHASDAA